jgi:hypothetical protein
LAKVSRDRLMETLAVQYPGYGFEIHKGYGTQAHRQAILEKYSLDFWNGRWASPEEMGYPLVTIGSRIFSYMSGQILYIDYGTASLWEMKELTS